MAAARIDEKGIERLAAIVDRMTEATAASATDDLITLNELFHDAIHEISRCRYLQRVLVGQRIYDHAARQFILSDAAERIRALREHRTIFEALARRDADAAEREMRDHVVRSARQHVKAAFESRVQIADPGPPVP
jgi:DNA-binding GntR family transcriptional regulator